jgi:hypothetical protein
MGDFIETGTLAGPMADAKPLPASANPSLIPNLQAARWNELRQALIDTRAHVSGWVNVRSYGAKGDGVTDDTAAIQAAIDAVAAFGWKGGTRLTERGATGGTVYFPPGVYRFTSKLRLAPGLRLLGASEGAVFTAADGSGTGVSGSILFADLSAGNTYAIDTSPYNAAGVRVDDTHLTGNDSSAGVATFVDAIQIEALRIRGNGLTKGLNLAGATTVRLNGVFIHGFIVGVRISASWYGSLINTTISARWKGLIVRGDVTTLTLSNFSSQQAGAAYDPVVSGWDGSEAHIYESWGDTENAKSAAIYNHGGFITGHGVVVERFQVGFASYSGRETMHGVYVEGITDRVIQVAGADAQACYYDIEQIVQAGNLIWMQYARLHVRVRATNYTAASINKVFERVTTGDNVDYMPVLEGIETKPPGDPITVVGAFKMRNAPSSATGPAYFRGDAAPSLSAPKGSFYQRKDGGVGSVVYVNDSGAATWSPVPAVRSGRSTFSGTGAQAAFTIAHGFTSTPTAAVVNAGSATAAAAFHTALDATNITVTFVAAPASGTNNVVLNWVAHR